ncbi:hypothetical protein Undi14_13710 [Undibacterium sp. 14-3-2]|uniref:hypothetical protein n=1 Tax=Undibacterium sp. 14-3-2 TaxID=2800129 RepID=UPI0019051A5E|nr:hypothetical protein [Undibacterium sp. 14-3-2]MBK1891093.1 hypothetical protein [Undibacterium sp. 14-3-2]
MFRLQKISNFGTSTPAVARTALQGRELLQFLSCPEPQKEAAIAVLFELQRHLVKCVEICDPLVGEVAAGRAEIESHGFKQAGRGAISLPGVSDLQSKSETFLQSAKLAIAETGNLVKPFYGVGFGHKYQKFSAWSKTKFGVSDDFAMMVESWEPYVKRIVEMRNAVDHPSESPRGRLVTTNFSITHDVTGDALVDPHWGLTGEPLKPVLTDFEAIIEKTIILGENVLVGLFYKLKGNAPFEIREIPIHQRDPANPRRLTVGFLGT